MLNNDSYTIKGLYSHNEPKQVIRRELIAVSSS